MKKVCMFCRKEVEGGAEASGDEELSRQGLCVECLSMFVSRVMGGAGKPLEQFLDTLPGPVFVVDQEVRVIGVNMQGKKRFPKDRGDLQGCLGGEVFECKYAKLPQGCGETIHCKACTIRKAVVHTAETGMPHHRVPAYMDLGDLINAKQVMYVISTEKVDDVVLLRIDDVEPVGEAGGRP